MSNLVLDEATATSTTAPAFARPASAPADTGSVSEEYLARRLARPVRKVEPMAYEFTKDPGLLHQYYRLREDMFISVWGLEHFTAQEEAHDRVSDIMVAHQGLHCIAGGRITISSPNHRVALPMEKEDFQIQQLMTDLDLADHTYCEFSRLAILPDFRGGVVFPEMARRFIRKAISEGVEYAFNIAPIPLARSYRQTMQMFGLKWELCPSVKIPEREEYEGIRMMLSVMDLRPFLKAKPVRAAKRQPVLADAE